MLCSHPSLIQFLSTFRVTQELQNLATLCGNKKMSSQSYSSSLSLKDIMENGFLISGSGYSISPGSFLEMNSLLKSDLWSNAKGNSVALKLPDSSLSSMKEDLQISSDGVVSFCRTPGQPCAFDLSTLSSANNSKTNDIDAFHNTKSSTPYKDDKLAKQTENVSKSSEINDLGIFKKPLPPPVLEISGIQATMDTAAFIEASLEEFGSLGSVKADTQSLDMSHFPLPPSGRVSVTKENAIVP